MDEAQGIAGLVTHYADKAIDYGLTHNLMEDEQAFYRKNQQQNFELSQQAQKNAASNTVEGLKQAGLSPALAAGMPQVAPMTQAPMQNKSLNSHGLADVFSSINMLELQKAQKENLDAQSDKLAADAEATRIKNVRESNANDTYDKYVRSTMENWKKQNPQNAALYDEILKDEGQFTKGAFVALKDIAEFEAFMHEMQARINRADLEALISSHQKDGGVWAVLANRPIAEVELLVRDAKLKEALQANAYAQSKSEGEKLKVLQKEQGKIEAEIKEIEETARLKRYGKYGNMYEHGDVGAAVSEIVGQGAEETAKSIGREAAEVGGDIVRAKTGTPHGIFRTKSEPRRQTREGEEESWKDRKGHIHKRYYQNDDAFPLQ